MSEPHPIDPVEIVAGRYQLRPPSVREAADFLAMVDDPLTRLWNPVSSVVDEESARDWCTRRGDWSAGDCATFFVLDATEGKLVGSVSLHQIDRAQQNAAVGYHVAPWARGRGVAAVGVRSVVSWGFATLDLVRIELHHAAENAASCRVAAKAGFPLEGELRLSHRYGDGALHNEHLHARLYSDPAVY